MAVIINASTSTGLVQSADTSGVLTLQTNSGTSALSISTGQQLQVHTAGTVSAPVIAKSDDTNTGIWFPAADTIATSTAGTERMRILSGGKVLINQTSSTIGCQLEVTGINTFGGEVTVATGTGLQINYTPASGTVYWCNWTYNGSNMGSITSSGSTTAYNTGSDYRLKENIAPITGALAKVAQLKPSTWTWKRNGSDGQGFIAHELAEVCPDAVVGEKDAVNAEGNPIYQGVDTSFLVATLTAAIQELKAELDATKAEVQALKGVS